MTHYQFFPDLIVRVPSLSCQTQLTQAEILDTMEFKTALFLASRSFFNELSKKKFDYDELNENQKAAVNKYINRARFRSTPFGLFSSIALINWNDNNINDELILSQPYCLVKPDFEVLYEWWQNHFKHRVIPSTRFRANTSFYCSKIDFRFLKKQIVNNEATFSVESLKKNSAIKAVLKFSSTRKNYQQILNFIIETNGIPLSLAETFLHDLVNEQLLISETEPNITGDDYSHLLSKHPDVIPENEELKKQLAQILYNTSVDFNKLLLVSQFFDQQLKRTSSSTNHFYSISKREVLSGGLNQSYQKSITEGLYCLDVLSQSYENNDLANFKTAFQKRYDSQEVPLLEVLDSQFGIGYGELDKIKVSYGFSSAGYNKPLKQKKPENTQSDLAAMFLNDWESKTHFALEMELTDDHLKDLPKPDNKEQCPPSISVMFRIIDENVFIESAGGTSALSLIGRFAMFPEIFKHAQSIAQKEESMNEEVLFAEIAHLCHLHTANINRRPHFYDYEIPVLTNSTLPEKNQIQLHDLFVSIVNNKIILKSIKLKKRIIPRLSSAFNYSKNSFPVFRFLCDLQSQDLKTAFHFSLSSIIPGLQFYPRIRYKSCIIQLAEWHLDANDLKPLRSKDDWFVAFEQLARKINLPRFFSYATTDLFLVFDSMKQDDILLLRNEICNKNKIVLKEFPFLQNGTLKTETNDVLIPQYVAALYKTETTYQYSSVSTHTIKHNEKKSTADWIYFKIYCHPLSSNTILTEYLLPLINKLKRNKLIKKWFWIRYNDPDYHIRIRVQISVCSEKQTFNLLTTCLNKLQVEHLIARFYPGSYVRELDRYSPNLIKHVEEVFQASSECIALLLKEDGCKNLQNEKVIIEAVLAMDTIFDLFEFSSSEKISISKTNFTNFFSEFNGTWELKAEIEKMYKQISPQLETNLSSSPENKYEVLKKKLTALILEYKFRKINSVSLQKLCSDIIHMHLNRLFIHEQRYFEMVCYYLLNRKLNAEKHRLLLNTSRFQ